MGHALARVGRLYDACAKSYAMYHEGTGCMHMPTYVPGCKSRAECLDATTRIILEALEARPGDMVLDLGCGVGTLAVEVARMTGSSVCGLAATATEVRAAADRAKTEGVGNLCGFEVRDMNSVGSLTWPNLRAIITLETDCYLHPLAERIKDIRRILPRGGVWQNIRFGIRDEFRTSAKARRAIHYVEDAWRTGPIASRAEFRRHVRGEFEIEKTVDLSDRVVDFWRKFVPVPLDGGSRVRLRFMGASLAESQSFWDVRTVFRHRLAFWKMVLGMAAGWFVYEYYRLRAI